MCKFYFVRRENLFCQLYSTYFCLRGDPKGASDTITGELCRQFGETGLHEGVGLCALSSQILGQNLHSLAVQGVALRPRLGISYKKNL